jgi:hypothetical protein
MKVYTIILLLTASLFTQDRSLVFTTGAPLGTCETTTSPCASDSDCAFGNACQSPNYYIINNTLSLSDRFYIDNNMALEALRIYVEAISETANAKIVLHSDNDGLPGLEIFSWNIDVVQENHGNNYILIMTTDQCIYLNKDNYYWLSVQASDTSTEMAWYYSNNSSFTYSTSTDSGTSWNDALYGNCGSLSVWAESIYEPETFESAGDINMDGGINVLDVVILANSVLNNESITGGDLNNDSSVNVLDVVILVNTIINGQNSEQLPSWDYVDINTNSNYFGQLIGPETFNGNVSVYYFGKAG